MYKVKWIKFESSATIPKRATDLSAGYDLFLDSGKDNLDVTLMSGERKLLQTNIGMIIDENMYGRIAPRSSLAHKYGIDVFGGVIDSDYRGKIGVILYNSGKIDVTFKHGDRIAQIILEKIVSSFEITEESYNFEEAQLLTDWDTKRGAGGFGSSGK